MSTLYTSNFLGTMFLTYDKFMNEDFKKFMTKVILKVDKDSEILRSDCDVLVDTLFNIQDDGDYSDEMVDGFLDFVELMEVNIRKPFIGT